MFDLGGVLGHIGVAMFVFEGNAAILNVRAECRNQAAFPKLLSTAIISVLTLFMAFSVVAYFVYKQDSNPIFVLNLSPINGLVSFIYFCVCFNCFISYPVQILCSFDIVE